MKNILVAFLIGVLWSCSSSSNDGPSNPPSNDGLTLSYARLGAQSIFNNPTVALDNEIVLGFSKEVTPNASDFTLSKGTVGVSFSIVQGQNNKELILTPDVVLEEGENYTLRILNTLTSEDGTTYSGGTFPFSIESIPLVIQEALVNNLTLETNSLNREIALLPEFQFEFSFPVTGSQLANHLEFTPATDYTLTQVNETTLKVIPNSNLMYWTPYELTINSSLGTEIDKDFTTATYEFFTTYDETDKFPAISDNDLLTKIQEETFKYFWDFGHPNSGMARERNTSANTVTTGGTGFGLMAMIVAVERGFITRSEAITRWQTIVDFLENADRFHGVWPHWLNGNTGQVQPFSAQDDGADLVETAFLIQGLLTVREYLNASDTTENALINKITQLWEGVEWTWFTRNEDVLYWHWSPNHEWAINLRIQGHNETQIVYVLAASSPTYPIDADVYKGYTRNGNFTNGNTYYNHVLPTGPNLGGPLFFSHYSYLGLDPRNLQDAYVNYWDQNVNHSMINREFCEENPNEYIGYSSQCWGLTASDNHNGYNAHSPTNDLGVITPTAAISALPYTPDESMAAIRFFYYKIGDRIWGNYGFVDAFNPTEAWYATSYLAIDQGPIICMIENYRTQLLWNLFMQNAEIQDGLDNLGFTY